MPDQDSSQPKKTQNQPANAKSTPPAPMPAIPRPKDGGSSPPVAPKQEAVAEQPDEQPRQSESVKDADEGWDGPPVVAWHPPGQSEAERAMANKPDPPKPIDHPDSHRYPLSGVEVADVQAAISELKAKGKISDGAALQARGAVQRLMCCERLTE
ncbi:MAG: hypothetical protein OXC95_01300 [Dehalococcoidia bacterium]|nr:hypothetical protein [Dehalococcoidia bacterium]